MAKIGEGEILKSNNSEDRKKVVLMESKEEKGVIVIIIIHMLFMYLDLEMSLYQIGRNSLLLVVDQDFVEKSCGSLLIMVEQLMPLQSIFKLRVSSASGTRRKRNFKLRKDDGGTVKGYEKRFHLQSKETPRLSMATLRGLKKELGTTYHDEEVYWKQRSRYNKVKRMIKKQYFHASNVQRKRFNSLMDLERASRTQCVDLASLTQELSDFYSALFTSSNTSNYIEVLKGISRSVTSDMNKQLTKSISIDEVKSAMLSMSPHKVFIA
ncbi:hypothetical protein ACH5RR_032560 [Cinchona calisaya]|uniref:Uncharacterized protein n=1 Tax=Cinchona calisaya TaxID=153742 RepID=A0ABD2YIG0_9GENT